MTAAVATAIPGPSTGAVRRGVDLMMHVVGAAAVMLLVAETAVLFSGVFFRYVLHDPLIWSDEIASTLFIWLVVLGAVLAQHRGEHMRLATVLNRLPEHWRSWCEILAELIVCLFILIIVAPAIGHATEQMAISTPTLDMPDGYRAAALPVGAILMLLASASRLIETASLRQLALGLLTISVFAGALFLGRPWLLSIGNVNLLVFFVGIVGFCMAAGVPIAFAFGTATVAYLGLTTQIPISIVVSRMDEGMSGLILLSIPLFVLLGALLELGGLARILIDFMASLLGHIRGGMEYVLLGGMFLVSGISGSKAADMAAIAPAVFPEMKKRGAKSEDLVALLSSTGAMTETIPPSLVLITIGAVCDVSIAALFNGGLVPALVATFAVGLVCWWKARRSDAVLPARKSSREIGRTFLIALPVLALPLLIRIAVVEGIATATEVSTLGVVYTAVVALAMYPFLRQIDFKRLYPMLLDAVTLSGAILLIIGLATAMAWALTQSGFSAKLVSFMQAVPGHGFGFLAISIVMFIVLGSVLEGLPAVVLFGPLLFPVARSLGIGDVHYAMVMILAMGIGLFAPPFGVGFYAACAIGKVSPDRVFNRVWPYLAALFIALLAVAFVPGISHGL